VTPRGQRSGFYLDDTSFAASIRTLSSLNNKSQAQNLLSFGRTFLRNPQGSGLMDILPPASKGRTGFAAKRQGEKAIERDLSRVFVGVKLSGERTELHPDPAAIHRRLFVQKRPGAKLRSDRGRAKYFVDAAKLRALARRLKSRVGRLASSLVIAAQKLGVRPPAWISRHGAGDGTCFVELEAPRKSIEVVMYVHEQAPVAEIERRVQYALRYTSGRIRRAIVGATTAGARKAGFRAA